MRKKEKRQQKSIGFILALIMFVTAFSGVFGKNPQLAWAQENATDIFIENISLEINDQTIDDDYAKIVEEDAKVKVSWKWSLPIQNELAKELTTTLPIPDEINIGDDITKDLMSNGVSVGEYSISKADHTISFSVFHENVKDLESLSGVVSYETSFNLREAKELSRVKLTFPRNHNDSSRFTLKFEEADNPLREEKGEEVVSTKEKPVVSLDNEKENQPKDQNDLSEDKSLQDEEALGDKPVVLADEPEAFDPEQMLINVVITDQDGNTLPNPTPDSTKLRIQYNYNLPDETLIDTSQVFDVATIPAEIKIIKDQTIPLVRENDSEIIGNVFITTDGKITIKFEDEVNNDDYIYGRKGFFYVQSEFDKVKVVDKKVITFDLGAGRTKDVDINVKPEEKIQNLNLVKNGNYNTTDNTITWTVKVKPTSKPVGIPFNDVVIEDRIEEGQTYIPDSATISPNVDAGKFTFADGNLKYEFIEPIYNKTNEEYTITFKTKPDLKKFNEENKTIDFFNKAQGSFKEKDDPVSSNTAKVSTKVDFISKSGKYDAAKKQINWTMTINNNNLDLVNPVITDIIPDGLELITDSVKLNNTSVGITTDGPLTLTGNTLKYAFTGPISTKQTLTFSTKVTDPNAFIDNETKKFTNTGSITGEGIPDGATSDGTVGVTSSIIEKAGISYNASTRELSWRVIVNKNNILIKNGKFMDEIMAGQEYVKNSFKVDDASKSDDLVYDETTKTLTYGFGAEISTPKVITFKTLVTNSDDYAGNKKTPYKNTATLTGDNIETSTSTGSKDVVSQVVAKSSTDYDYNTRLITWKIDVNQNQLPLKNAKFTDTIPEGLTLRLDTIMINGEVAPSSSFTYDEGTRLLTYTFPESIDKKMTVTFKTEVTDLSIFEKNGETIYRNTATFVADGIKPVSSTDSQKIISNVADKKGTYEAKTDFIDWEVLINKNQIAIPSPVLEDTLQVGLSLDLGSIKLQKVTIKSDNSYVVDGNQVPITMDNITYDPESRVFTFKFLQDIDGAYLLSFSTNVDEDAPSRKFVNSITLQGQKVVESDSSNEIVVSSQSAGGGASGGSRGSITLTKADADDQQKLIPGTKFELLDKFGNIIETKITDENGVVKFSRLVLDVEYTVKEVTPSEGYLLTMEPIKFTPTKDTKNLVKTVLNTQIKSNIVVLKTGEGGEGYLEGAVFQLLKDGKVIRTSEETGKDGKVTFENIPYGLYRLVEITAPKGYNRDPISRVVNVTDDGKTETVQFINTKIRGHVEITKIDEKTEEVLPGAVFELLKDGKVIQTSAKTSTTGKVRFENLEYGTYTLREKESPEGYTLNNEVKTVEITENGKTYGFTYENKKITSNLEIVKQGENEETFLPGAVFELLQNDKVIYTTEPTSENGKTLLTGVEYGKYVLRETVAPVGYNLSTQTQEVEVTKDGVLLTRTFKNSKIRGNLRVKKIDHETEEVLPEAVFELVQNNVVVATSEPTDENGLTVFENVEYGTYQLKEKLAPEGYVLNDVIQSVQVTTNGETYEFTFMNQLIKSDLKITKVGEDIETVLAGAVFEIYQNGEVIFVTEPTDENGVTSLQDLAYGSYAIKELTAPVGYTLSSEIRAFNVTEHGVTIEVQFSNTKIRSDVEIGKRGEDDNTFLPGAVFELLQDDEVVYTTEPTDATGKTTLEGVVYDKYIVREKTSPEGYNLGADVQEINVTEDGDLISLTFTNTKIRSDVEIVKLGEDNETFLPGAVFELLQDGDVVYTTEPTDETGKTILVGVEYGKYNVREKTSPEGYNLGVDVQEINITEDGVLIGLTFSNTKIRGHVEIKKLDTETEEFLSGAVFELLLGEDVIATSKPTDENGIVRFEDVEYGTYQLREKTAPVGYVLNEEVKAVVISENEKTYELTFTNTKIKSNVEIVKLGEDEETFLPGAVFELLLDGDVVYTTEPTDENGKTMLEGVNYGVYVIREKVAPTGYTLSTQTQEINIVEDGATLTRTFMNAKIRGHVEVKKIDAKTNEVLAGAIFELLQNDVVVATSEASDENGIVRFLDVEFGTYSVREKTAPMGYILTDEEITVVIDEDEKTYEFTVENEKIRGSLILTKTNEDGEVLAGAIFEVKDEDGRVVGKLTTDTDGNITLENLVYGKYTVVEVKAPKDYLLDETIYEFSIEEDNQVVKMTIKNKKDPKSENTEGENDEKGDKDDKLPASGSDATLPIYLLGIVMISLGGITLLRKRKMNS